MKGFPVSTKKALIVCDECDSTQVRITTVQGIRIYTCQNQLCGATWGDEEGD